MEKDLTIIGLSECYSLTVREKALTIFHSFSHSIVLWGGAMILTAVFHLIQKY